MQRAWTTCVPSSRLKRREIGDTVFRALFRQRSVIDVEHNVYCSGGVALDLEINLEAFGCLVEIR